MNKLKKAIFILFGLVLVLATPVVAVNRMESDSYKIRFTNLNMTSGSKSSDNYNILDTVGQTAAGEYASSGYKVKAGFVYIKTIIPFAFTISDLSIDLGLLAPQVFSSTTNTLTVSAGGAGGYAVTAYESHPLRLGSTAVYIDDTTCNTSCSETTADVWTNTAKYGFGYNMSGDDVPAAFTDSTYFKQFADESGAESAQTVMSSSDVGSSRVATVTYKANIAATQASGNYQTDVVFIATPTY